uniref:Ribosomal protein lateral stalk subunit P1 n=1 Tax=Saimiri boliviensis boliviensis TaxID=39432 RepID=A0A2K6T5R7_SAIBB
MASVSELACIYSALILHDDEVTVTEEEKWKQRKKNPRSLMMIWALVFLTKHLL